MLILNSSTRIFRVNANNSIILGFLPFGLPNCPVIGNATVLLTLQVLGVLTGLNFLRYFSTSNVLLSLNSHFPEAKYLDQPHIRVAIQKNSKKPALENWINYHENRKISELLKIGNYGLRTGKKLGDSYFCALDIDQHGEQFHFSQISYVESQKGIHYYLLLRKLPEDAPLFYQGEKIGRIMSSGKPIIGSGSIHPSGIVYRFIERGEVFLKFNDEQELVSYLNGYGIVLKK
jgi:hypothetical protein